MAKLTTETIKVNFGPQHPSTHGVLYVEVELDGEVVADAEAHIGYLHRAIEKLAEYRHYNQVIVLLDRTDYITAFSNELAFVLAVEKIMQIEPPERAQYLRVILTELNRIASHLFFYGTYGLDLGATTPFLYAFREREKVLDLFDMAAGYRMTPNFFRFGGVKEDVTKEFFDKSLEFVRSLPSFIDDYENLLSGNEIFILRTQHLKLMSSQRAINWGITGPVLRATGVNWDLRKKEPYSGYEKFDFEVPLEKHGDCYSAYKIRLREMRESAKIVEQAIEGLPSGPVIAPHKTSEGTNPKQPLIVKPPKGEAYATVESPRGELGMYVISDGSEYPYRLRIRPPTFVNLMALREFVRGWKVADLVAFIGILDIVLGEIDR